MRQTSRSDFPIWSWGVAVAVGAVALGGWLWQPQAAAEPKAPPPPSISEAFNIAAGKAKPTKRAVAKKAAQPAARPVARAAARPKPAAPDASHTLGVACLANPEAALRSIIHLAELSASKEIAKLSQEVLSRGLGQILPQLKSVKLHRAVELLPAMLQPLGLELSKPMGVLMMKGAAVTGRPRAIPVVFLTVNRARLIAALQLLGFSPKIREQGGMTFLTVGKVGMGSALGVLLGERLYMTFRTPPHPIIGANSVAQVRAALAQLASQKEPLKRAFADAGKSQLWQQLRAGKLSGAFVVPDVSRIAGLVPPNPATMYVRRFGGTVTLMKHRYQSRFFLDVNPKLASLFAPFLPAPNAKNMFAFLPPQLAIFAQAQVDLKRLLQLPQVLVRQGLLPPQAGMLARMQIVRFQMAARNQGIDVNKLMALFSGQFLSGIAWDQALRANLKEASMRQLFRGHMHGVFALFRARTAADGPKLLQELGTIVGRLNATSRSFKGKLTATKTTLQGVTGLEIKLKGLGESMFLLNKGDLLAFAGSKRTAEQFAAVWQGAAPSLAQRLKRFPQERVVYGPSHGNFSGIVPRVIRQLLADRGLLSLPPGARMGIPPQFLSAIKGILRTKALRFQTLFGKTSFETTATFVTHAKLPKVVAYSGPKSTLPTQGVQMLIVIPSVVAPAWPLAGLPVGITAAVAIPAFLRFTRRSKSSEAQINIKAISDGAIAWFDAEHADSQGNPMPKHFPNHLAAGNVAKKRSVSTWPKAKPCANGKAMYPKNAAGWNREPWRSLRFGINKPHHYQYTYITEGTGMNATFTVIARGDLDCDGKLSKFVVSGKVNKANGEVERSQIVVTDGLE